MVTVTVRLPDSIHKKAKEIAKAEGVSLNQFISSAVAEKLSAVLTVQYLGDRAAKGSRREFDRVMSLVPDCEPPDYDKL